MAIAENAGVKVDSSDQNLDNNTASTAETKPPCPDDQKSKSNSSVETPNLANELIQSTSEVDLKSEISTLNPMAKEFVPSSLARTGQSEFLRNRSWFTNNFPMQAISVEDNGHFATKFMSSEDSSFGLIMAIAENAGVKVNSSDQSLGNNTASTAETKPPCPDDQNLKSNSSVETPNLANELIQSTSEVNLKSEISTLNPMAKEFVPSSLARTGQSEFLRNRLWFTNNFPMQAISVEENGHFATPRKNFGQGNRWKNRKTNLAQNEDVIRRTVYVSDIDQQVTEEQLASLFLSCGQVVDCRICGDHKSVLRFAFIEFTDQEGARSALKQSGIVFGSNPIKVLLSKTAIAPVNPTFLPRSEDEREKCAKTVYCTNIDKMVNRIELEDFFKTACGEVHNLRLLGDHYHRTRIAFVEFKLAESAVAALNCSGVVLGGLQIRVSPSKTPVRPQDFN